MYYISLCLYIYYILCVYIYYTLCLYIYLSIHLYIYTSIHLYIYTSIHTLSGRSYEVIHHRLSTHYSSGIRCNRFILHATGSGVTGEQLRRASCGLLVLIHAVVVVHTVVT